MTTKYIIEYSFKAIITERIYVPANNEDEARKKAFKKLKLETEKLEGLLITSITKLKKRKS